MEELSRQLDEVFRREKLRVVGTLVRVVGTIDAAEEAFQDAVVAALEDWPARGVPANPGAWLTTVAHNRARDRVRHRRVAARKEPLLWEGAAAEHESPGSIPDDSLRLIFTCYHPVLSLESRVALTLKVVLGMSVEEIARAFLSNEQTIAQRIVRAKRMIEERGVPYEVPERGELAERASAVLAVIFLVFNEGHTGRAGPLMRLDLQEEALRLARALCDLMPREPEAFGLYALIAFALARAATRTDAEGQLVRLSEQDRARWDRRMIREGLMALSRARRLGDASAEREPAGPYALQAEIAACHATAPRWESTDWARILSFYDSLAALDGSPVVKLNRAVALSMVHGARAGLVALDAIEPALARYHHFYAVRAELRRRDGQSPALDLQRALALTTNDSERQHIRRELGALGIDVDS